MSTQPTALEVSSRGYVCERCGVTTTRGTTGGYPAAPWFSNPVPWSPGFADFCGDCKVGTWFEHMNNSPDEAGLS